MLFYEEDTVDVGDNQQVFEVDNTTYPIVHNNHWLKLTMKDIVNYVLFPYHLSAVFVQSLCFCRSERFFHGLQALYQQFQSFYLQQVIFAMLGNIF